MLNVRCSTFIPTSCSSALLALTILGCQPTPQQASPPRGLDATQISGARALEDVRKLVAITPRNAGSKGAAQAAEHLRAALRPYTQTCEIDAFEEETPKGAITFRNIIGSIPGTRSDIVILASHYDTKSGIADDFQGANDSGSSSGLLIELARTLHPQQPLPCQIMFALFDGEECMETYRDSDGLHGSRHLVQQLRKRGLLPHVKAMILLDMVGDRDLTITLPRNVDRNLMSMAFDAAREAGIRNTFTLTQTSMLDDHVPFLEAGVPAIDLIDFQYGSRHGLNDYWHTPDDTMEHISADSLQSMGQVVIHMLNAIAAQ